MPLTSLKLQNFTAFAELDLEFSPGVNILVGENGTGKTHVMKVCYAACEASKPGAMFFHEKLVSVFLPSGRSERRLVNRHALQERSEALLASDKGTASAEARMLASVEVRRDDLAIRSTIRAAKGVSRFRSDRPRASDKRKWDKPSIDGVYIPVKEMLSNAPGFLSLYEGREIHFEEVYRDIVLRADLPFLREQPSEKHKILLSLLEEQMGGSVTRYDQEFYLMPQGARSRSSAIEFTLLAEGIRKLGLLWLLIRNGSLREGSVLFWDEPETNLNPTLFGVVVDALLELQRQGVQVFIATHNYVVLKEFDLRMKKSDNVLFHSFHRTDGGIACNTTSDYLAIEPNAIAEAFSSLYDRQIERSIKGVA